MFDSKLYDWDREHVWHAFTQMAEYEPFVIESGQGCTLVDSQGREYLDGVSSLWCNVHGHRHPTIDAAIRDSEFARDRRSDVAVNALVWILVAFGVLALAVSGVAAYRYFDRPAASAPAPGTGLAAVADAATREPAGHPLTAPAAELPPSTPVSVDAAPDHGTETSKATAAKGTKAFEVLDAHVARAQHTPDAEPLPAPSPRTDDKTNAIQGDVLEARMMATIGSPALRASASRFSTTIPQPSPRT